MEDNKTMILSLEHQKEIDLLNRHGYGYEVVFHQASEGESSDEIRIVLKRVSIFEKKLQKTIKEALEEALKIVNRNLDEGFR